MYKCDPEFYDKYNRPFYQAMYNGNPLKEYYFLKHQDEYIFVSFRRGSRYVFDERYGELAGTWCLNWHRIKHAVSGKSKYPKVGVVVDDWGNRKTIHLHQIVAQTFHAYPIPDGVTESEWKRTPKSVRKHFENNYWEANHIDHNHLNFHPDNLEWVSRGVNVDKYHTHRVWSE